MSKTQFFVTCFVIAALSFAIGFIASYHYYQDHPDVSSSKQHYYSSKTYTLGLVDQMPFGKHKGKSVQEVLDEEPGYISWMMREVKRVTFTEEVKHAVTRVGEVN